MQASLIESRTVYVIVENGVGLSAATNSFGQGLRVALFVNRVSVANCKINGCDLCVEWRQCRCQVYSSVAYSRDSTTGRLHNVDHKCRCPATLTKTTIAMYLQISVFLLCPLQCLTVKFLQVAFLRQDPVAHNIWWCIELAWAPVYW